MMEETPSTLFNFSAAAEEPEHNRADLADPPIATVQLETSVPHLDRSFDYLVPKNLEEKAQPGVRIKTKFGHQTLGGYILERKTSTQTQAKLQLLDKVISTQPVLPQSTYQLCSTVAERFAGITADVIRSAVPPRVAGVDKSYSAQPPAELPEIQPAFHTEHYGREVANLSARCAAQEQLRARLLTPVRYGANGWTNAILLLVKDVLPTQHSAVVVVPNQHLLDQLCLTLDEAGLAQHYSRLTAEDGPTQRYRGYLELLHGQTKLAVGTRSAVLAPVQQGALMIVVDDDDTNHQEPRAPYWNTRDVALLRAQQEQMSLIFVGWRHSIHTQRLVNLGYLEDYEPHREHRRQLYPRVIVAADEYHQIREYGPGSQRIPSVAWQTITAALHTGPVLIQVARTGFIPAIRCTSCGTQARCKNCSGPLGYPNRHAVAEHHLVCRWCGEHDHAPSCAECGSTKFKAAHRGAERTAEELGRAFTNIPVISSSGEHIKDTIEDQPALVVATPGAEPIAPTGYAATILLDGNTMLAREGLDTPHQVFGRWVSAMALTRSHDDGGILVITADPGPETNTLARLDIPGYYHHLLQQRMQTGLPPVRRLATIEADSATLNEYLDHVQKSFDMPLEIIGPAPLDEEGHRMRALLFFTYKSGQEIAAALRGSKAALSAQKKLAAEPLRVKIDPEDAL